MHLGAAGVLAIALAIGCAGSVRQDAPAPSPLPRASAPRPPGAAAAVPSEPVASEAPAATPPVAVPATPMAPVRLEDFARFLDDTGIQRIDRVERLFRATDRFPEVTATWAHDASGTWLCRETPGTETRCATLPTERVGRPALDRGPGGATLVRALWVGDDRATMTADIDMSGAITAQRRGEYVARENAVSIPPPPSRSPPPALGALAGIDLVSHLDLMVASSGSRLTVCRARPTPVCAPIIDLPVLARGDRAFDRLLCIANDTICSLGASWGTDVARGTEDGSVRIFLGVDPEPLAVRVIATVHWLAHRSTPRGTSGDLVELTVESEPVALFHDACLRIDSTRAWRTLYTADGGERRLGNVPLRRAPNQLPPEGLDPFRVDLTGAWDLLPAGGMRRRNAPCQR